MSRRLSRRTVLRGLGVTMALPMLEAMTPSGTAFAKGARRGARARSFCGSRLSTAPARGDRPLPDGRDVLAVVPRAGGGARRATHVRRARVGRVSAVRDPGVRVSGDRVRPLRVRAPRRVEL